MSQETEYEIVIEFKNQSHDFAFGWECGIVWERICAAARRNEVQTFSGTYHKVNVEQLSEIAQRHGYKMAKQEARLDDGTDTNYVHLMFSNDPNWLNEAANDAVEQA